MNKDTYSETEYISRSIRMTRVLSQRIALASQAELRSVNFMMVKALEAAFLETDSGSKRK